ncbi:17582_t:CDS:2, partial [Cetraspora pellucida]
MFEATTRGRSRHQELFSQTVPSLLIWVQVRSMYNKLLCEDYMHWKEKELLILSFNEMPILREYLSFISIKITYDPEKSLLMLINRKVSLLEILLKVYNDSTTNELLKIDWNTSSKHRPGALYDAFTEANVLGPKHILALV